MDRSTVKTQAKAIVLARRKPILIASALFLVLSLLLSYLSMRLQLPPADKLTMLSERVTNLMLQGDYEAAYNLAGSFEPSFLESMVSALLSYLLAIVSFGYLLLLYRAVHGQEPSPGMLLDGFALWLKVLLVELISRLVVTLGLWAFLVPGLLVFYSYRMAPYLLASHPDYGVVDCLRESRQRMRGHRIELFLLDLSFLGWLLLSLVPVLGLLAAVWALPYWNCSCIVMYDAIFSEHPERFQPGEGPSGFF